MADRIGIGLGDGAVRALLVRRERIVWSREIALAGEATLDEAILGLLGEAPRSRLARWSVTVAVGPGAAKAKRLSGLPSSASRDELTSLVRLGIHRFFRMQAAPVETSSVVDRNGEWWCAAIEAPILAAASAACRAARVPLRGCVPAVAVLGASFADGVVTWSDGDVTEEVTIRGGACVAVRPTLAKSPERPAIAAELAQMGDSANRFADAYGAACTDGPLPLAIDPDRARRAGRLHRRIRMTLAALLLLASAAAIAAPTARARWSLRVAAVRMEAARLKSPAALDAARELAEAAANSRRVREFAASRRAVTLLLGRIAAAMPDSTAIMTIRVDGASTAMVTVAPVGTTIIPDLTRLRELASAQVVGPVTQESAGALRLQRASIRLPFRSARPVPRTANGSRGAP
jgi:hypothetical protein